MDGDLTAAGTAALQAIFDSLGKHLGPEDRRSIEQRQHDALEEALGRLIKARLLPESAGQEPPSPRSSSTSASPTCAPPPWNGNGSPPGAGNRAGLTGPAAEAEACDALIAPVVTGSVDWTAVDQMAAEWITAYGLDGHRRPCGCVCGCTCTCTAPALLTPEQKQQLRRALLAMAADAMSGPGGLAAYLRTRQLGVPYAGKSLPLDMGRVKGIPDHLRRAVILRDQHCQWPGGCDRPPAGCQVHHVVFRSRGGKTRLKDLILLCHYHHQVCIHRLGWTLTLHPDGTTEACSPAGQILRSHGAAHCPSGLTRISTSGRPEARRTAAVRPTPAAALVRQPTAGGQARLVDGQAPGMGLSTSSFTAPRGEPWGTALR